MLYSAEIIGLRLGLSSLVVGILLIGLGTSLPEMFVSHIASLDNHHGIALGNIIGSNISNLLLIMGTAGILTTLKLRSYETRRQIILHLVLTGLLVAVIFWGTIGWISMAIFGVFFCYYLWDTLKKMKRTTVITSSFEFSWIVLLKFIFGLILLFFGGEYLIGSVIKISTYIGIDEYIISAVVVAFGTSLPELVTAIVSCRKKKDTDLIVGNIIGSNIFNMAFVLGSLGIYNFAIKSSFYLEIITLVSTAIFLFVLSTLKKSFARLTGALFLCSYFTVICLWIF